MQKKLLISRLLILAAVCFFQRMASQSCTVNFSYSTGANGSVTFTAFVAPANTYTYSWQFSASTNSSAVSLTTVSNTYTAPGVYVVTLTALGGTCSPSYTGAVVVTTCVAGYSATPATFSTVCDGSASLTVPAACAPATFSWSNGFVGPTQGSLCGNYTVFVSSSNPLCCSLNSLIVSVPANTVCNLQANYIYTTVGLSATFTSISTGTLPGSTYLWEYGDGNFGSGVVSAHTYTSAGPFSTRLLVNNVGWPGCTDSTGINSISLSPCTLSASINYSQVANGTIRFLPNFTGITGGTQYSWNFGDGGSSTQDTVTHAYSAPGNYTVTLLLSDPPNCTFSTSVVINVSFTCSLTAAFVHTVGTSGIVSFASSSSGTTMLTSYLWDFGDGWGDIAPAPTHTYSNAGTHYVKLKLKDNSTNCSDSVTQSLNITGISCAANAQFTLFPTPTPQFWLATPAYPYNVSNATWYWGDGSSSNSLFASHVYSLAGNYNICLSVTVSCGSTATYCASYGISKPGAGTPAGGMYSVNVVPSALKVGLSETSIPEPALFLQPNPCPGSCLLSGLIPRVTYRITDFSGRIVSSFSSESDQVRFSFEELQPGIYFLVPGQSAGQKAIKLIVRHE